MSQRGFAGAMQRADLLEMLGLSSEMTVIMSAEIDGGWR